MKKSILITVILVVIPLLCHSQQLKNKTMIQKDNKGKIESVEFSSEDASVQIPESAEVFFRNMLKTEESDQFKKFSIKSRRSGYAHEHFDQYYKGIKVDGAGYNFHYKNSKMYFAHGHYVKIGNLDIQPAISKEEGKNFFASHQKIPLDSVTDYLSELLIKEIPVNNDTLPVLVYKITLFSDHVNNTEIGYVDAQTGKVLATEPALINYAATGTFATRYSGTQTGVTHYYNGAFHLVDSTANRAIIHTWNLNGNTNTANRTELSDNDNNWTQAEHAANNNNMALDIHWALQQIRNRLFVTYGVNSFDDDGFPINAHIRHATGSSTDNAYWNPIDRVLLFGSGYTDFLPLASLDVVAHEFGHGITHFQIGWGVGSAFNEGLSDIWGAIMESQIRPSNIWQIGEQITNNYECLRNLQSTNSNRAKVKIADTYESSQYNNGDYYVRSGVFSHWFYLLVNGGSGTNAIGNSYTVHGVGMDNGENLIAEAVFNNYLSNTTSYGQIRTTTVNAARVLDGGLNGFFVQQVENAWYAVGVGSSSPQTALSGPNSIYSGSTGYYTVENLPSSISAGQVTWSCSSNLQFVGGNTGTSQTVNALSTGSGWVRVHIPMNGNPIVLQRNITIIPLSMTVSITENAGYFHANTNPQATTYEWKFNSRLAGGNSADLPYFKENNNQSIVNTLKVRASVGSFEGECEMIVYGQVYVPDGEWEEESISYYPNPASTILTVDIDQDKYSKSWNYLQAMSQSKGSQKLSPSFVISLYTSQGQLLQQQSIDSSRSSVQFNVSGLYPGLHFLLIHDNLSSKTILRKVTIQ
jgi:Zn-dependent metalloprotease